MRIRSSSDFGEQRSRYYAEHAEQVIAELDAQYARGEIERHAYLEKKRGLVRLFLKATTEPKRRRVENYDGD